MKNTWALVICLAVAGCNKPASVSTTASGTAAYPRASDRFHPDGMPGVIIPLTPDQLLGASSVEQRDDLAEAVARYEAHNPRTNSIFVGFLHLRVVDGHPCIADCDFSPALLRRLSGLKPRVKPVSAAKWGSVVPSGMISDSDDSAHGVTCIIETFLRSCGMRPKSRCGQNRASVRVH